MGQCCGFVKTDSGINMHQEKFSREIEEHLDKLQKDRIIEAQETSSLNTSYPPKNSNNKKSCQSIQNQILLNFNIFKQRRIKMYSKIRENTQESYKMFKFKKELKINKINLRYQIHFEQNQKFFSKILNKFQRFLELRNHLTIVGSIGGYGDGRDIVPHQSSLSNDIQKQKSGEKQFYKKETTYDEYEVKVVEASILKENQNIAGSNIQVEKTEKLEKLNSQQSNEFSKQKSENQRSNQQYSHLESLSKNNNEKILAVEDVLIEKLQISLNNSFNQTSNEESFNNSREDEKNKENIDNKELVKKVSGTLQQNQAILNQQNINNQANTTSGSPINQALSTSPQTGQPQKDSTLNNGGLKSILLNTLAKKDDPNSGSKPLYSQEDSVKVKKSVKLASSSEKRFDTDFKENTEKTTPVKPKGVLKKYDPNSSYSETDSPRIKTKKKVKFKESTFKKQQKKKRSNLFQFSNLFLIFQFIFYFLFLTLFQLVCQFYSKYISFKFIQKYNINQLIKLKQRVFIFYSLFSQLYRNLSFTKIIHII